MRMWLHVGIRWPQISAIQFSDGDEDRATNRTLVGERNGDLSLTTGTGLDLHPAVLREIDPTASQHPFAICRKQIVLKHHHLARFDRGLITADEDDGVPFLNAGFRNIGDGDMPECQHVASVEALGPFGLGRNDVSAWLRSEVVRQVAHKVADEFHPWVEGRLLFLNRRWGPRMPRSVRRRMGIAPMDGATKHLSYLPHPAR